MRENIKLRRGFLLPTPPAGSGVLSTYVHSQAAPGLGRIAAMVAIQDTAGKALSQVSKSHCKWHLLVHCFGICCVYLVFMVLC